MEKLLERVAALEGAMQEMEGKQRAAEERVAAMSRERQTAQRQLNRWRGVAAVLALLVVVGLAPQASHAQLTLDQRVAALEAKLKYLETGPNTMVISGANLFIHNGTNTTGIANGLGNLILGFNEPRPLNANGTNPNVRTGSHNLVLGVRNNYRSYGGIVAGDSNEISGGVASVIGGRGNTASSYADAVSGGFGNTASGGYASVSGGRYNAATGIFSSVSGGESNLASGWGSSVSGGYGNTASSGFASVSGGFARSAPGNYDWAAGGLFQPQ